PAALGLGARPGGGAARSRLPAVVVWWGLAPRFFWPGSGVGSRAGAAQDLALPLVWGEPRRSPDVRPQLHGADIGRPAGVLPAFPPSGTRRSDGRAQIRMRNS